MELKSVSGFVAFVKDTTKTYDFYKRLGFRIEVNTPELVKVRINWYWIDFIKASPHKATGSDGLFVYVSVDDVDEAHKWLKANKIEATEPEDFKSGRRETMTSDPDGYKLVFFEKK